MATYEHYCPPTPQTPETVSDVIAPTPITQRADLLRNSLGNTLVEHHRTEPPAQIPEVFPALLGLQRVVLEFGVNIVNGRIKSLEEDKLVLGHVSEIARAHKFGQGYEGMSDPLRPTTRSQKRGSRKIEKATTKELVGQMQKNHMEESYGDAVTRPKDFEKRVLQRPVSAPEKRGLMRASKTAKARKKQHGVGEAERRYIAIDKPRIIQKSLLSTRDRLKARLRGITRAEKLREMKKAQNNNPTP